MLMYSLILVLIYATMRTLITIIYPTNMYIWIYICMYAYSLGKEMFSAVAHELLAMFVTAHQQVCLCLLMYRFVGICDTSSLVCLCVCVEVIVYRCFLFMFLNCLFYSSIFFLFVFYYYFLLLSLFFPFSSLFLFLFSTSFL